MPTPALPLETARQVAAAIREGLTQEQVATRCGVSTGTVANIRKKMDIQPNLQETKKVGPADRIDLERQRREEKRQRLSEDRQILMDRNETLEKQLKAALKIREQPMKPVKIGSKLSRDQGESVAVVVASDWHNEEEVTSEKVNGLNEYNLEIFHNRAVRMFQGAQRLWYINKKDTTIKRMILAAIGDFLSGNLHEDQSETNLLGPTDAIANAERELVAGIRFLLAQTDLEELTVVCKSGNHGRFTKKQRHSTEAENSLEYLMFHHLRQIFEGESRVKFVIEKSYLTHVVLWDAYTIRFHHGHDIKYGQGVGGIYIPTNKKISMWNRSIMNGVPPVKLDVFGHFHQYLDADNFVLNGSLIGYNPYAIAIGAPFQTPRQAFFLINRRFNEKTMCTPIFVEG